MRIRRLLLLALLALAPGYAEAVSVEDLIALSRAGLGDEVLVALVETGGSIYTLSTQQIVDLKRAGVSERVIVLMLRQGRTSGEAPQPPTASSSAAAAHDPPYGSVWQAGGVPDIVPPGATIAPPGPSELVVTTVVPYAVFPYPVFVHRASRHAVGKPTVRHIDRFGGFVDRSGGFGRFINDGFRTGTPIRIADPVGPRSAPPRRR
jgi:hypothetical protein